MGSDRETTYQRPGNGLSLIELSQIEEAAHHSQTCDAKIVLRLAAALREALQEKKNAEALAVVYKKKANSRAGIRLVGAERGARKDEMRLRSTLNPEEQTNVVEGPSRHRKGSNQRQLVCGFCNGTFYVDEVTFRQAMSAMEEGGDNPFCCDECEAEQEELSH